MIWASWISPGCMPGLRYSSACNTAKKQVNKATLKCAPPRVTVHNMPHQLFLSGEGCTSTRCSAHAHAVEDAAPIVLQIFRLPHTSLRSLSAWGSSLTTHPGGMDPLMSGMPTRRWLSLPRVMCMLARDLITFICSWWMFCLRYRSGRHSTCGCVGAPPGGCRWKVNMFNTLTIRQ